MVSIVAHEAPGVISVEDLVEGCGLAKQQVPKIYRGLHLVQSDPRKAALLEGYVAIDTSVDPPTIGFVRSALANFVRTNTYRVVPGLGPASAEMISDFATLDLETVV